MRKVILMAIAYIAVFGSLSILKHLSLHSTYLDLGLESQSVYNTAHGRFLKVSFGENGEEISALSYHVSPITLIFTPLYLIWSDPIIFLIAQTIALALGAIPVYLIAKKILENEALATTFAAVYLLYPPIQYTNLSDFHPVALATAFLLFTFYFALQQKWKLYWFFFVLSILCKENISLTLAAFGAWFALSPKSVKEIRKTGALSFFTGLAWFLACTFIVMPAFGGSHGALGRYSWLLTTPIFAIVKELLSIHRLKFIFHLLVSVGFLPLLSPAALAIAIPQLAVNLLTNYNPMYQVRFHYTSALTAIIFLSAIFGMKFLITKYKILTCHEPKRSFWLMDTKYSFLSPRYLNTYIPSYHRDPLELPPLAFSSL